MENNNMSGQNGMSQQSGMMSRNGMSQQNGMMSENGTSQQNQMSTQADMSQQSYGIKDYGAVPVIFDMEAMAKMNDAFRAALWTGDYLQITVMSLQPGEDIGVEMHDDVDQFIRIEEGDGIFSTGVSADNLSFSQPIGDDDAIVVPAGSWHNLANTGDVTMKLFSIYAPPQHARATIHRTKADADAAED